MDNPWAAATPPAVKAGDSGPLLCSSETLPGALHPALGSPRKNECGTIGADPEECHEVGEEDWSSSPMKTEWESWGFSVWRRGCVQTS